MTYDDWESEVPECIKRDTVWKLRVYRLGLFLCDLCWADTEKLYRRPRLKSSSDQLYRASSNISSNVCEGYSRGTGKDRARFYEYSLGSAREVRDWYYKCRRAVSPVVVEHRMELATEIIRLTLTMISNERRTNRRIAAA